MFVNYQQEFVLRPALHQRSQELAYVWHQEHTYTGTPKGRDNLSLTYIYQEPSLKTMDPHPNSSALLLYFLFLPGRPPRRRISWQPSRWRRATGPRWRAAWSLLGTTQTEAGWWSTGTDRRPSRSRRRWKGRSKGGRARRSRKTSPLPWEWGRYTDTVWGRLNMIAVIGDIM